MLVSSRSLKQSHSCDVHHPTGVLERRKLSIPQVCRSVALIQVLGERAWVGQLHIASNVTVVAERVPANVFLPTNFSLFCPSTHRFADVGSVQQERVALVNVVLRRQIADFRYDL